MNHDLTSIWYKLDAFQFDVPNLRETFPEKLAASGGWTKEHAAAVIQEYKKFLLLTIIIKDYRMVPPPPVDLAWAIHERYYPLSYYEVCTILCRNLSRNEEQRSRAKFNTIFTYGWLPECYDRTIQQYTDTFPGILPIKIWQPVNEWFSPPIIISIPWKSRVLKLRVLWIPVFLLLFIICSSWYLSEKVEGILLLLLIAMILFGWIRSCIRFTLRAPGYANPAK